MNHSKRVREFVTAESLRGLRRKQRAINARSGAFFRFENEQQYTAPDGKLRWVSFYYVDLDSNLKVYGQEMIEKLVKKCGNSGRIYLPPDWIDKRVKIIRIE